MLVRSISLSFAVFIATLTIAQQSLWIQCPSDGIMCFVAISTHIWRKRGTLISVTEFESPPITLDYPLRWHGRRVRTSLPHLTTTVLYEQCSDVFGRSKCNVSYLVLRLAGWGWDLVCAHRSAKVSDTCLFSSILVPCIPCRCSASRSIVVFKRTLNHRRDKMPFPIRASVNGLCVPLPVSLIAIAKTLSSAKVLRASRRWVSLITRFWPSSSAEWNSRWQSAFWGSVQSNARVSVITP